MADISLLKHQLLENNKLLRDLKEKHDWLHESMERVDRFRKFLKEEIRLAELEEKKETK
jgi:hypothetical protein